MINLANASKYRKKRKHKKMGEEYICRSTLVCMNEKPTKMNVLLGTVSSATAILEGTKFTKQKQTSDMRQAIRLRSNSAR